MAWLRLTGFVGGQRQEIAACDMTQKLEISVHRRMVTVIDTGPSDPVVVPENLISMDAHWLVIDPSPCSVEAQCAFCR